MNPIRGTLGSPNFVVKRELFLEHSHEWDTQKAADYFFISSVFKNLKPEEVFWWNKTVFEANVGLAKPEIKPPPRPLEYAFHG